MPGIKAQLDLIEFGVVMGQEYADVPRLPTLIKDLCRLARRHGKLQEKACNQQVPEDHDARCEASIRTICEEIGCEPIFSGDPRGATVKLKVKSGRCNDWGGIGICVPQ